MFSSRRLLAHGGDGGDPYWSHVSLLMHMDGSNGSTTFTDSSDNAFAVTAFGNAAVSTAESMFGGASLLADGTGDYVEIAANAAFAFGTADFTVECWVYVIAFNSSSVYLFTSSGNITDFAFEVLSSGAFQVWDGSTPYALGNAGDIGTGQWHHVAFCRSAGTLRAFKDGTQVGSVSLATDIASTRPVQFPASDSYSSANCYVDELRVTKAARYVTDFTPRSTPFPEE